jgi:hypothetical protein
MYSQGWISVWNTKERQHWNLMRDPSTYIFKNTFPTRPLQGKNLIPQLQITCIMVG